MWPLALIRRSGGDARRGMSGRPMLLTGMLAVAVLIVEVDERENRPQELLFI